MEANVRTIQFSYKYVKDKEARGWKSKTGSADEQGINLDGNYIPYNKIYDSYQVENRLVIGIEQGVELKEDTLGYLNQGNLLILEIYKTNVAYLKRQIDRFSTLYKAKEKKETMESEGRGADFRSAQCPSCLAIVDLTDFAPSKLTYCRACETVFDDQQNVISNGNQYSICNKTGYYDRIQQYTEFYFYFLLVLYGFRSQKVWVGDYYAGSSLFPKLLFANFLFILGVPNAFIVKARSGKKRPPGLENMPKLIGAAKSGKTEKIDMYAGPMLAQYPNHPGVLMNMALGYMQAGKGEEGIHLMNKGLEACSNYMPILQKIARLARAAQSAN